MTSPMLNLSSVKMSIPRTLSGMLHEFALEDKHVSYTV